MVPGLRVSGRKGGHLGHGGRWSMAPHSRESSWISFPPPPRKERKKSQNWLARSPPSNIWPVEIQDRLTSDRPPPR